MKNISLELKKHLKSEVLTLTNCLKIERKDDQILGLTDHDEDLYIDGVLYKAQPGFNASAIHSQLGQLGLGDNLEIDLIESDLIKEEDILSGAFDNAYYTYFSINYKQLEQGKIILQSGYFGKIQLLEKHFLIELKSMSSLLNQTIGSVYTPYCRATLGDFQCGSKLQDYSVFGCVTGLRNEPSTHTYILQDNTRTEEDGYFDGGNLTWISGPFQGLTITIKKYLKKEQELTFFLPLPGKIVISDKYKLTPGCNKSLKICRDKFNNVINFRGEPFIPGTAYGRRK
ncbi:MAG: DUF2163 domain-containing protein [Alphaproteobacteria bacterium]|nr:DUF2163 domain-containing protein [Alphaproteobacteria bacterium]